MGSHVRGTHSMKEKHLNMYMKIAETVAASSYAQKLKVGAVAVKDNRILSIGYNGTPPGMSNVCERKVTNEDGTVALETVREVIHAEMNLIYKMARDGQSAQGSTLFVTHAPCFECAKAILSVGIKNVFYKEDYRDIQGVYFLRLNFIEVEKYA